MGIPAGIQLWAGNYQIIITQLIVSCLEKIQVMEYLLEQMKEFFGILMHQRREQIIGYVIIRVCPLHLLHNLELIIATMNFMQALLEGESGRLTFRICQQFRICLSECK